jgi:Flp pilus assembly protein TadG
MVEFAITAGLIFIPLVFGIIEFGRLTWSKTMITAAAREGVRYAIIHGSSSGAVADSAAIANWVIARTSLSPIVVTPRWADSKDPGDTAIVTVTYVYTPVVNIFGSKTITSTSKQIIAF